MGAIDHVKILETLKALPKKENIPSFQTEIDCWVTNTHQFSEIPVLCGNFIEKVLLEYCLP